MKTFAQAIDLVDDPVMIAEYESHHHAVWPDVLQSLRAIGIERMHIYRLGSRLFMWCEVKDEFDPRRDYQRYASNPRCAAWDALMRKFQRQTPGATGDSWWTAMSEIFSLESSLNRT